LLPVPSFHHELTLKATHSGVVLLRDGRYKKRYTGSKTSAVDINGNLHLRSGDLQKLTRDPGIKKPGKLTKVNRAEISAPITGGKDRQKSYTVNKTEVRNRIYGMINTIRREKSQLYFFTITFPAQITDQLAYQAFNTWLTVLRQKKWLKNYLWVAERQDGKRLTDPGKMPTNNIHFHIAIPHYLSIVAANRTMQTILATYSRRGQLGAFSPRHCKRYNGIELAKDKKTKKPVNFAIKKGSRALVNYLTKYVTKNNGQFSHLAWHNSRGFSALFTGLTFTFAEFQKLNLDELVFLEPTIENKYFFFFAWINGPPDVVINHLTDLNTFVAGALN